MQILSIFQRNLRFSENTTTLTRYHPSKPGTESPLLPGTPGTRSPITILTWYSHTRYLVFYSTWYWVLLFSSSQAPPSNFTYVVTGFQYVQILATEGPSFAQNFCITPRGLVIPAAEVTIVFLVKFYLQVGIFEKILELSKIIQNTLTKGHSLLFFKCVFFKSIKLG